MAKKTGLVLTGGGARAAYQVGALRALTEILDHQKNPFSCISGISAGAINAGFLACRAQDWKASVDDLHRLWKGLELERIYRTDSLSLTRIARDWIVRLLFGTWMRRKNRANFLLNTQPLRELIQQEMDFTAIQENLANGSLQGLSFSALNYTTGTNVSFFHAAEESQPWRRSGRIGVRADLNAEHVMASSAIPVFFPPVNMGSDYYGDGSLKQLSPLSPAIHMGAERILAISIRFEKKTPEEPMVSNELKHAPSLAEIGGQLMNSLFLDALDGDLERLERINQNVARDHDLGLRQIPILVLKPSRNLEEIIPNLLSKFPPALRFLLRGMGVSSGQGNALMSYLAFLPECILPLLELGYADTLARKDEILKFLKD